MNIPIIKTQRLILREFRESDLDAYAEMCADKEVMRYIGTGKVLSRAESWRSMAAIMGHWYFRGYGLWAVEEQKSGEMIGRVGCWKPEGWIGLEIGWCLRKAFWGNGFATEAGKASMGFAFNKLEQSDVISLIRPDNLASIKVAEKLGEKLQGKTEVSGKEAVIYGISREEWQKNL
ncbi:GCN5-related N-acetyltransferase [Calothrix parasitica NIES-267]|uniref:GCN5-related N-acetyltransferase n=1 Tax=Calothrix parasitica NIES-267 TaxID=1973488 RepID=A0A1Z4LZT7_9CYAN|nr:GCN5-related N-acetyltransferase [Calothrix parasitica NIES-267]